MSELKPYLADVPVRVNIWIRPECQRKQFEVLKQARPSIMFLISDGGRNEKEWEAIYQNRAIFDNEIDWECTIYKLYEDKNNGLYTMGKKGSELIWSKVDRCIFLEDDQVVSVSYFKFCEELLEKYKDDTRISGICAMNLAKNWDTSENDYFFAKSFVIWGLATWKRVHEKRDYSFSYGNDPYAMKLIEKIKKKDKKYYEALKAVASKGMYDGHVAGGEFFHAYNAYLQNQLFIMPKVNMMKNIGCTENAAHSTEYMLLPKAMKKVFNMPTYEVKFPLNHPCCIVCDDEYDKKAFKVMGRNHPAISFCRRVESILLSIRYGVFFKRLKKRRERKGKIEK